MKSILSLLTLVLALGAVRLAAQTSPAVLQPLGALTLRAQPNAVELDLRDYFGIPGVSSAENRLVQFDTVLGKINVELLPEAAPLTVANFLSYVQAGSYTNSFFHRSVPGFIVQGGNFIATSPITVVAQNAPIINEYNLPNVRGTIAMAKLPTSPNSATNQWFFNLIDNTDNLGPTNNGGFAVFGRVLGEGMTVVDALAALFRLDATSIHSAFGELPVYNYNIENYNREEPLTLDHLVRVHSVTPLPLFPLVNGQDAVLSFSLTNSNPAAVAAAIVEGHRLSLTPTISGGEATIVVRATDTQGSFVESTLQLSVKPISSASRLVNLSFLAQTSPDRPLLAGFVLVGEGQKPLLLRGVGPTLRDAFKVGDALANPSAHLSKRREIESGYTYDSIATNDNWHTQANSQEIIDTARALGAFDFVVASPFAGEEPIAYGQSDDAAIFASLDGGVYSLQVTSPGATGAAQAEIYDADPENAQVKLTNLSTLRRIEGGEALQAGFVIRGEGSKTLLIRGIGPALQGFGLESALSRPRLALYRIEGDGSPTTLTTNEGWSQEDARQLAVTALQIGAFELEADSGDAAILATLEPGVYSAHVSSVSGEGGDTLLEIYEVY